MTYNGWANYPTWCVHLWLANDPDTYAEARSKARCHPDAYHCADALKEWVGEHYTVTGMAGDLLTWALGEVDWPEIVAALSEE